MLLVRGFSCAQTLFETHPSLKNSGHPDLRPWWNSAHCRPQNSLKRWAKEDLSGAWGHESTGRLFPRRPWAREVRPCRRSRRLHRSRRTRENGWAIVVTTEGPGPARRIRTTLSGLSATPSSMHISMPQSARSLPPRKPDPVSSPPNSNSLSSANSGPHGAESALSTSDMRRMPAPQESTPHPGRATTLSHDQHGIKCFIEPSYRATDAVKLR